MNAAPDGAGPLSIHASAVVVGESGVLIRGASGAGKSSLALGLIAAAERAGRFARLIGDDRIEVRRRGGRLIARGHARIAGKVERRGQGILEMDYEPAAVARLVVDLLAPQETTRYPADLETRVELCGVALPVLALRTDRGTYDSALIVLARLSPSAAI